MQVGVLEALLRAEDIPCRSHSLHLEFLAQIASREGPESDGFRVEDYAEVSDRWAHVALGDWLFARRADDDAYLTWIRSRNVPGSLLRRLRRLRPRIPRFLDRCAEEILAAGPTVVGFTATYTQTLASLALAGRLKERAPDLKVVFGGACCEGPMGAAMLRAFPAVDVVVRGEGERVVPELMRSLLTRGPIPPLPGLCRREGDRVVEAEPSATLVAMEEVPAPIFDEYFERLRRSGLAGRLAPEIPFESARGCWWGEKSHCTFCGLNGLGMRFRSKAPDRVLEEVTTQAGRHRVLDFCAADNILDPSYFTTLLPRLAEGGHDLRIFYEVKANLSRAQVFALRAAGVRAIQPGIESLSTPILKLMRKGVTAPQNVRLLKWCREAGIEVVWNLLYGFPGEAPEEYARMAEILPSLVHLPPPRLGPLVIDRFSPYHERPGENGLRLLGPLPHYRLLHPDVSEPDLADLALTFDHAYLDGRDPRTYVAPLRDPVERWNREADANRGALTVRRGPGFLVVTDLRTTFPAAKYILEGLEAEVFEACEAGANLPSIRARVEQRTSARPAETEIRDALEGFRAAGLLFEDGGRYLALALSEDRLAPKVDHPPEPGTTHVGREADVAVGPTA